MTVQLPDFSSIQVPNIQPDRAMGEIKAPDATAGIDTIAAAAAKFGSAISSLGTDISSAVNSANSKADALGQEKANSQWLVDKTNLDETTKNEDDTAALKNYGKLYQDKLNAAAGYISDPAAKQKFLLGGAPQVAAAQVAANARIFDINKDTTIADTNRQLQVLQNQGSALDPNDNDGRTKFIDQGNALIQASVDAGYYTKQQGQQISQEWAKDYATNSIMRLPPAQQMAALSPVPQGYFDKVAQLEMGGGGGAGRPNFFSSGGAGRPNFFSSGRAAQQGFQFDPNHPDLTQLMAANGQTAQVNKFAAPALQGFVNDLQSEGYDIHDLGGYNNRNKRGGNTPSEHAFGNAIDINPSENSFGGSKTDMPANVSALAAKWGLSWGGNWSGKKDFMHFEWTGPGAGGSGPQQLAMGAPAQPTIGAPAQYPTRSAGAQGKYQFMPGTWARYGQGGDINNPAAQENAVRLETADNYQQLQYRLGRAPTEAELYLAHQQGPTGALRLLDNQDTRAGDLVGAAAISGNGGDPNAPARDFINKITAKYGATGGRPIPPGAPEGIAKFIPAGQRDRIFSNAGSAFSSQVAAADQASANERSTVTNMLRDDASSIANTGVPLSNLTHARVALALGDSAATDFDQTRATATKFYNQTNNFEQLPAGQILAAAEALKPSPGNPGFVQQQQFYDLAQQKADATLKQRTMDPAAAVANAPQVKLAQADFSKSNQADPASFYPVLRARVNAQRALGMGITSPITNDEAKVFADRLKPIEETDARLPGAKETIDGVLNDVSKKYGPYAEQAMARVLYQMPVKEGVSDMMAKAISRMHADATQLPVNETMARQLQMTRDQDRLKVMSGVVTPATSGAPPPLPENSFLRPPSGAIDILRNDPVRVMPFFLKHFGADNVPPDLQGKIPPLRQAQ